MPQQDVIDLRLLTDEQLLDVVSATSMSGNHAFAAEAVAEVYRRLDYAPPPKHNIPNLIARFLTGSLWRQKSRGGGGSSHRAYLTARHGD